MEGLSVISYKGKQIIYVDYSINGESKEKTMQLIKAFSEEPENLKCPPKSALVLINVTGLRFDKEVLNAIKDARNKVIQYEKKTANFGMSPIQKAAYNFMLAMTASNNMKIFNSELEAKEWLIKD